jgi:hypothetical protein
MSNKKVLDPNIEIITNLLSEFQEQREAIKEMIGNLDKIKEKIDALFPESIDKRYVRLFEEKVKAVTALFNTLLDMRKEIVKGVKDEIELRRRLLRDEIGETASLEEIFDIRKIAKKVEQFRKQSQEIEKQAA